MKIASHQHHCNAWCHGDVHADVAWSRLPPDVAEPTLRAYMAAKGKQLRSLGPAPEAPATSPGGYEHDHRYLVTWVQPRPADAAHVRDVSEAER
jgi:hypothetical protein